MAVELIVVTLVGVLAVIFVALQISRQRAYLAEYDRDEWRQKARAAVAVAAAKERELREAGANYAELDELREQAVAEAAQLGARLRAERAGVTWSD